MTNKRRDLMLQVSDDFQPTLPLLYYIDRLRICDEILDYCVKNNLTGKKFYAYFENNNRSILETCVNLIRSVKKNRKKAPIYAHKDFIV